MWYQVKRESPNWSWEWIEQILLDQWDKKDEEKDVNNEDVVDKEEEEDNVDDEEIIHDSNGETMDRDQILDSVSQYFSLKSVCKRKM